MASQLEARVRDDIINGRLMPGSRLPLKELAEHYQAGTIPLREALSRLAASGFIKAEQQKGFSVNRISTDEILDITRVRIHIESQALTDSIKLGDVDWETRVLAAHHRLSRLPAYDNTPEAHNGPWETTHETFHFALISSCNSPWLLQFAKTLHDQTARYRFLSLHYSQADSRDIAVEHHALMEAALARDTKTACKLLANHYQTTANNVLQHELLQANN
jgi:DNA-binding GntR family transcriptional regulator